MGKGKDGNSPKGNGKAPCNWVFEKSIYVNGKRVAEEYYCDVHKHYKTVGV